jgi:hypothetical protein
MRLFPDQFHPENWLGSRKQAFAASSDAFQQLVGDALVWHFSALAHVASTAGRDGAIDAWVEGHAQVAGQFDGFEFPLIVECKHHDDGLANTAHNIKQGWSKVKEKLIKQAADGWPKLYAPWKQARSYLYCISARFPNQQTRDDLQKEIRDFFSSLPVGQRPEIEPEQIRVWDWSDLQAWLNLNTILCDRWLGIELAQWIDHLSLRERLAHSARSSQQAFQAYLLEEYLPFVPPADDDLAHPSILLQSLAHDENLLLIGEGGIGKTRTMQEVAELAQTAGWRVLHLLPSEQDVDLGAAAEVLLRPAANTLVLIDYIDQLAHFDARYWHSTLLPEARRRGVRLHLLTNARPSGSSESLQHLQDSGLFRSIEMTRNTAHRERVATAIEDRICPTAINQIGRQNVKNHCGKRPIIAMFIAQALERLALAGKLENQQDDIPRPDDLLGWIRKRLREAELFPDAPPRSSRWQGPPAPPPELISIAAALAVCPFPQNELPEVVRATLTTLQAPVHNADWIVDTLEKDGWIEAGDDGFFRAPHDAIPDEVLREILDQPDRTLPGLLSSAPLGRPLGRFARSLGRLSGIAALPPTHKSLIEEAAKRWLMDHAQTLGQVLVRNQPDVVAYALGALFDYRPWHVAAQTSWNELIAPWLGSHGGLPAARHLLHRGLKSLPGDALLQPALAWLSNNRTLRAASFILGPLVGWDALRLGDQQKPVLAAAVNWLAHPANGASPEAEFVLQPLLGWDEARLGEQQKAVLIAATCWLEHLNNATAPGARFLFNLLLRWDAERLGDQQAVIFAMAVRWLEQPNYINATIAGFVLDPLLSWDAARLGARQATIFTTALRWLEHPDNHTSPDAQFVLHPLLSWDGTRFGGHQKSVLTAAVRWLTAPDNAIGPYAAFVLAPLLNWHPTRLRDQQNFALTTAMGWLQHVDNVTAPYAGFVLAALLSWDAVRLCDQQDPLLTAAICWLEYPNNISTSQAQLVLHSLLSWDTARFGHQQVAAFGPAIRWLDHPDNAGAPQVGFALQAILKWKSLPTDKRREYVVLAIDWMDLYSGTEGATHVLKSLLQVSNRFANEMDMEPVISCAFRWLDRHADHPERGFVIARLLRIKTLAQDRWAPLANAGLDYLEKKRAHSSDDYLLNGIMSRLSRIPAQHGRWTALAVRWLASARCVGDAVSFFNNCRKFLPEACLEAVRPDLVAANRKRPDLPEYDWARPFLAEYRN